MAEIMQKHLQRLRENSKKRAEQASKCICGRDVTFAVGKSTAACACGVLHRIKHRFGPTQIKCQTCADQKIVPFVEMSYGVPCTIYAACNCADLSEQVWYEKGKKRSYKPNVRPYAEIFPHGLQFADEWYAHEKEHGPMPYTTWLTQVHFPMLWKRAMTPEPKPVSSPDPLDEEIPF